VVRVRRYRRLSELPELSALTRRTLVGLENPLLYDVLDVVDDWHRIVADGKHAWFDRGYRGCGFWGCCPPTEGIRTLLLMVEPVVRRVDREVLYAELRWVESVG
jgi:hypothetical protein